MSVKCSKCGWPIMAGEWRRRRKGTQEWEHMPDKCMSPAIKPDDEIPPYRELTDSEQAAEDATWD